MRLVYTTCLLGYVDWTHLLTLVPPQRSPKAPPQVNCEYVICLTDCFSLLIPYQISDKEHMIFGHAIGVVIIREFVSPRFYPVDAERRELQKDI